MIGIRIDNGDGFEVVTDADGDRVVKIENRAFVEEPQWLYVAVAGKYDRRRAIDELIAALVELRDNPEPHVSEPGM